MTKRATDLVALLRACTKTKDLHRGIRVHDAISESGLVDKCSSALVTMYAKCGQLAKAKELLDLHQCKDLFSWTTLITAYTENGHAQDALDCFDRMQQEGLTPDAVTFACILKACGLIRAADKGEAIRNEITRQGMLGNDVVLGNALVDMYAKCGALDKAEQVLNELPLRDVVSWNSLLSGYIHQGQCEQAIHCFEKMRVEQVSPNVVTFVCVLNAYGNLGAVDKGEHIHDEIRRRGLLRKHVVLGNALIDMYAKCGALAKAQVVLEELPVRDIVSWNTIIAGYMQQGQGEEALQCFEWMEREGLSPDAVTFSCILKACSSIGAAHKGELIHDEIKRRGLLSANHVILGTSLVDMYAKCGALVKAHAVLEELPVQDAFCWSALIVGYVQQGQGEQALDCFVKMQHKGLSPDAVTFSCILEACGSVGAVDKGEQIHNEIARQGLLENDVVLGNALVDMYAKCGALGKARRVLEELLIRDVVSWSVLIGGYVHQCQCEQALNCFECMLGEGISPNAVTFSSVLSACSRLGLVEKARNIFSEMSANYGCEPDLEHYTCMVDLFGRIGKLQMAAELTQKMPLRDRSVWCALLGACLRWGDVDIGRWAFEHAVQVDETDALAYVLMAKIYSAGGMQEDAAKIEALKLRSGAEKLTKSG
ncbi:hypothetical protein GOP47_0012951 [Adiantum capillus-veneris]|uniref:Pentatricopeptide repeat-containing protein n=1 Tax=Adiantum capillus-veneris TaxID=13818 RepID=A0A9D4US19_ADICA|nr:hypothetical protein GOP47_0012951 [Adiantum capillus-veneris]